MDRLGKVANPARGELNRENEFRCPRSRLRIWSRETVLALLSCVSRYSASGPQGIFINECCLSDFTMNQFLCPSHFPPPLLIRSGHDIMCDTKSISGGFAIKHTQSSKQRVCGISTFMSSASFSA